MTGKITTIAFKLGVFQLVVVVGVIRRNHFFLDTAGASVPRGCTRR